ncbi:unnamed protein product [Peniophora sp. CBMAI 1063]|nr:unnamed protein product [Peniophora sp. CBMAI 1063]
MSNNFATFAPYAPPPDEQPAEQSKPSTSRFARPWFPTQQSSTREIQSYQSGGVPIWDSGAATGFGSEEIAAAAEEGSPSANWETRFGYRVDVLAAFAYVLGPVSAFLLLIFETSNDYVRFHAYQSALFTTPLVLMRIMATILGFWAWLRFLLTLICVVPPLYMAYQAFIDASRNGLARYHIPFVGDLAEQWLEDE